MSTSLQPQLMIIDSRSIEVCGWLDGSRLWKSSTTTLKVKVVDTPVKPGPFA
jgi:hypothetical protein